jgi:hypothetical protein
MPVSPSLALGLGSGSDSGSTSAAGPASVPPCYVSMARSARRELDRVYG